MHNAIYFRRAGKIAVDTGSQDLYTNFSVVASFDANLRKLGFALDGDLAAALLHEDTYVIDRLAAELIPVAKEAKGVRRYTPMYPNFPKQVMEASEAELYVNAIMHYFGTTIGRRIMPVYAEHKRPDLNFDESKLTLVRLGSYEDFEALIANLLSSKSAFSETDKADIKALSDMDLVLNKTTFDNRENKAFVANEVLRRGMRLNEFKFDTATDVLRLAVAMSDGDVSLSENTTFRNFKRPERRLLLGILDKVSGAEEDMLRHASAWKRLGERLHPGEQVRFPNAQRAFSALRNDTVEVFNAKVEKALAAKDVQAAVSLLRTRPGDFARRLDHVLRLSTDNPHLARLVVDQFDSVAHKVSPTVLLQTRNAFVTRKGANARVFFPKGSVAKMQSMKDTRASIGSWATAVVVSCDAALAKQFSERSDLGGSYVDPALKGVAVPFGLRNASAALKTLGRGSRLALDAETGVIRFFIWWKDAESGGWGYGSHTDIDLSAVILDDKFKFHSGITYYNLRENGAVHSGDITSAPDGASEFIDIDVNKILSRGGRYVAMTLHSYSGQQFSELPECFAGFMQREDLDSGEIYDPRTVTNKVDLTANSRGATPFIFDLLTGEAIWVDLSMAIQGGYSNVASTKGQIVNTVEAMVGLTPPNLYDLFSTHAAARGGIVSRDKAKTVFGFDGDVTPFDTEKILAEYL